MPTRLLLYNVEGAGDVLRGPPPSFFLDAFLSAHFIVIFIHDGCSLQNTLCAIPRCELRSRGHAQHFHNEVTMVGSHGKKVTESRYCS